MGSGFESKESMMTQSSFCLINLGTDCGTFESESKLGDETVSSGSVGIG